MDAVETELLADRTDLVAEDADVPLDVGRAIRAAAPDLVVEDNRTLVSELLERREVMVRRTRPAVEREQRYGVRPAIADDAIPSAVTTQVDVSLVGYHPAHLPS